MAIFSGRNLNEEQQEQYDASQDPTEGSTNTIGMRLRPDGSEKKSFMLYAATG